MKRALTFLVCIVSTPLYLSAQSDATTTAVAVDLAAVSNSLARAQSDLAKADALVAALKAQVADLQAKLAAVPPTDPLIPWLNGWTDSTGAQPITWMRALAANPITSAYTPGFPITTDASGNPVVGAPTQVCISTAAIQPVVTTKVSK